MGHPWKGSQGQVWGGTGRTNAEIKVSGRHQANISYRDLKDGPLRMCSNVLRSYDQIGPHVQSPCARRAHGR